MNVSLTAELERRIAEKVESGLYTTASEVVREGLRLLFQQELRREERLARLRADIAVGLEEGSNRGEGIPADQLYAELTGLLDAMAEER